MELHQEAKEECKRALRIPNAESFDLERFGVEEEEYYQEELQFLFGVLDSRISSLRCKKQLVMNEWMPQVGKYLKSLTAAEWKNHLRVKVENFRESRSFKEALIFAEANHTWKYWFCPRCEEKFGECESQLQHVLKDHVGNLSREHNQLLPKEVNQDWVNKFVNGKWDPIDVDAMMDQVNTDPYCEEWPICDDADRRKLLRAIHACLTMLVKYNYLSLSNLQNVLRYTMKEVQAHASGSVLLKRGLHNRSVVCIQLLDSLQLQKILKFLKSLSQGCKLGPYAEHGSPDDDDDALLDDSGADERIRAILDPSLSYIDLDLKITDHNNEDTSCPDNNEIMCVLSWYCKNQNFKKHLRDCFQLRDARKHHGDKIIQKLKKELEDLRRMCTEKRNLLSSQDHLQYVERICRKELTTSFEVILKKRKEELAIGLDVISDVIMAAKASKDSQKGDDATTKFDVVGDNDTETSSLDNSCINAAFQTLEESLEEKIGIIDAMIMKNLSTTRKLKSNLALTSSFDYLTALAPLLKCSVLDGIIKAVVEDTEKEPGAAKEVSLTELLCDAENNNGGLS